MEAGADNLSLKTEYTITDRNKRTLRRPNIFFLDIFMRNDFRESIKFIRLSDNQRSIKNKHISI